MPAKPQHLIEEQLRASAKSAFRSGTLVSRFRRCRMNRCIPVLQTFANLVVQLRQPATCLAKCASLPSLTQQLAVFAACKILRSSLTQWPCPGRRPPRRSARHGAPRPALSQQRSPPPPPPSQSPRRPWPTGRPCSAAPRSLRECAAPLPWASWRRRRQRLRARRRTWPGRCRCGKHKPCTINPRFTELSPSSNRALFSAGFSGTQCESRLSALAHHWVHSSVGIF